MVYDDGGFISKKTITSFANTNEQFLKGSVKGMVVELPGFGGDSCLGGRMNLMPYDTDYAKDFAENGILTVYAVTNPWCWGSKQSVRYIDAVVRAIAKKYNLEDGFHLTVCGGSMGGLGAFLYAADSSLPVSSVAAACPCTDMQRCLNIAPEFPRSCISAAMTYDLSLEQALKNMSPIERIDDFPNIPYFITSDGADELFSEAQCNDFVVKMRNRGLEVEYVPQPGLKHGEFFSEVRLMLHEFIKRQILGLSKITL